MSRPKACEHQCRRRESKPGESARDAATEDAGNTGKFGPSASDESPEQSTVLDARSTPEPQRIDPDEALRVAIKAAVDVGDVARARALLDILEAKPKPAPVVRLEARRGKG